MAEKTRVSENEIVRRESFIRATNRDRQLLDPFTWEYRYKAAGASLAISLGAMQMYNVWAKKPWYFSIVPRLGAIGVTVAIGYGLGMLREYHNKVRDAVVEHYIQLHPQDFDHFKDRSGRPYADVLLPWYPHRSQYQKFD